MEPKTQVEIQLGHMCNNRCVFCVSGQQTALGRAGPMAVEPILRSLTEAYAAGQRKITLLGGEPTLQPGFLAIVKHAVKLGFSEIVIFTNGVKTAREGFIEEIVRTGGTFTWRISIQGATEESHDRTTRRVGSFARIVRSMVHLKRLGQPLTVNMCVVGSNHESVEHFPRLIAEHGVKQLHLDMMRPMDAGERTDSEFREMLVRYSDMVPALSKLAAGTPAGFDLNIGNLPYCVAPELAPFIHHDGETTYTIAVDGENVLSRPWDKYAVKRRDKSKPPSCSACVFDRRCNGIFDKYREIHGDDELVPVPGEVSPAIASRLGRLRRAAPHGALVWRKVRILPGGHRAEVDLASPSGETVTFWLEDRNGSARAGYTPSVEQPGEAVVVGLRSLLSALSPKARAAGPARRQVEAPSGSFENRDP